MIRIMFALLRKRILFPLILCFISEVTPKNYMIPNKDHFIADAFLQEVVNRMGKDLAAVAADSYLDFSDINRLPLIDARSAKDIDTEERFFPLDYESLGESNINPSIRDQEYLQHSSLWGSQYVSGGAGEGKQQLKPDGNVQNRQEIKTDSNLPAYCNPPNPCPVGYDENQGCTSMEKFENTAAFSRRYQASQDCMCDSEHMFDCPSQSEQHQIDTDSFNDIDLGAFMENTLKKNNLNNHRLLLNKKYIIKEQENPFLRGERLPVAAKKGNNVLY